MDAIYRTRRGAQVDPELARESIETVRAQAGQNVIVVMESCFTEFDAVIWILHRVLCPLIGILAAMVFGLRYQTIVK